MQYRAWALSVDYLAGKENSSAVDCARSARGKFAPRHILSASRSEGADGTAPRAVVVPIPVSKPADLDEAFATIVQERVQAMHVHPVPVTVAQRVRVAGFAIERRVTLWEATAITSRLRQR